MMWNQAGYWLLLFPDRSRQQREILHSSGASPPLCLSLLLSLSAAVTLCCCVSVIQQQNIILCADVTLPPLTHPSADRLLQETISTYDRRFC